MISLLSDVLCFVAVLHLGLFEIKLQKPGGPVRQGNLVVYCLFSMALLESGSGVLGF